MGFFTYLKFPPSNPLCESIGHANFIKLVIKIWRRQVSGLIADIEHLISINVYFLTKDLKKLTF